MASDLDPNASAVTGTITGTVSVSGAVLASVYLEERKKTVLTADGGWLSVDAAGIDGEIIKGTLDMKDSGEYVLTVTLGLLSYQGRSFPRGLLAVHGTMEDFHWDVKRVSDGGVEEDKGTWFDFETAQAKSYFTVGMTEFDQYATAMELYNFGADCLKDLAWPTYEFSVDSANFLYHEKFEPFRDVMELGRSVHLNLDGDGVVDAKLIGFTLDMEDISSFSLVFSNRYKLRNQIEALRDEVASASRAAKSFDAGKYIYNRTADKTTQVEKYMDALRKGAAEAVLSSKNQSVVVGGTGIHIGGDSKCQLRLTDSMIAMSDDGWDTAKVGIGRFSSPETGIVFGVNAELLAGTLLIGKNMVLQNPLLDGNNQPTGTMMFKVDATGAWLYNSRMILQNENGVIAVDPNYGIVAGTKLLFDSNGTIITPEFMDSAGELTFDKDGMPVNANFFLDGKTGNAYFRGKVHATDGVFNGTVYAKGGEFTGKLKAATLEGDLISDKNKGGWIRGPGISVGGDYEHGTGNFYVDQNGNLTLKGSINLSGGSITWGKNSPVKYQFGTSISGPWHDVMTADDKYRRDSLDGGTTWGTPYQFRGVDGKPGTNGSDASVTRNNIVRAMLKNLENDGLYVYTDPDDGKQYLGINASAIRAGEIEGINIRGGKFYNTRGGAYLEVAGDGDFGDFTLYRGGGAVVFKVRDDIGVTEFQGYNGSRFLTVDSHESVPVGTWDFSSATVKGMYATFA